MKSIITINVYGLKGDQIDRISSHEIKSIARAKANDFTFIMKAPEANKYTNLTIEFEVSNSQLYLLNFNLLSDNFSV